MTPTAEDQIQAGKLRGRHRLGYTDLLSPETIKRHGPKETYSSDMGFDTVTGIRRVIQELEKEDEYSRFLT